MTIRAVVFDIGGVFEIVPEMDAVARWESTLGLAEGTLSHGLLDVWNSGCIGTISEADVHTALCERGGLSGGQADALLTDMWKQYLGVGNTELIEFASGLRPRYRTGILSNSFVGAREREESAYGFSDVVDDIVYSHEVGMSKPDPRIFRLSCARLRVEPEQMVFLDDVAGHVAAAGAIGIHAVHYRDNAQAIAEIEALLAADPA